MGIIRLLSAQDARRIAAGEVIDRPASILRELLDNAIDAGATEIEAHLTEGGIREIRVIDNGSGMSREDMELCWRSHATSKISGFEDIYITRTLGFRGEALSSIAACSRLSITSGQSAADPSFKMDVQDGALKAMVPAGPLKGTVVTVQDVFHSMPGRKKFLKRPSSETAVCRQQFVEKAIPHPGITFRLFSDGELKILAPAGELPERIRTLYPEIPWNNQLLDIRESTGGSAGGAAGSGGIRIVAGTPAIERRDRKLIQIYVNGRRINEFGLVQAVEYAFSAVMPGGVYPAAFVLLTLDPQTVDFNIHPAKREAKFRNLPELHRRIQGLLRNALRAEPGYSESGSFNAAQASLLGEHRPVFSLGFPAGSYSPGRFPGAQPYETAETAEKPLPGAAGGVRYIGQAFGLFLVAEKDNQLYFIDQHAAHERLLYASFETAETAPQPLLTPYVLDLTDEQIAFIEDSLPAFAELGIRIEKTGPGEYSIVSMPANALGEEKDIAMFISENKEDPGDVRKLLFADLACRKAVKEGEYVDALTARELISGVFEKGLTRCPHGRPIFFTLSWEKMAELVGRTGPVF